ncbi:peptide ABC transporter substrate-binding protein [Clostridium sp. CS001]|uniref:peptide ABC transporter substrate-binding protein n=1 Tax=Clostridium sp. CS001 TaxID=2880648 RepID=UPI001CF4AF12|nr:peptide ABC transporter substrate-binding protein [Clostridium sp. CS001]MCB2290058.1 peptide ABC transporter substrate-binding protein [Clostridium sp. CS001]
MLTNKTKKISGILLTIALSATMFMGCADKAVKPTDDTKPKVEDKKVPQVITFNLGADPKTIDPALNAAVDGSTVIANAFEGLMRVDEKDMPIPGVAEKYEISPDGLKYTFHLRKEAVWSDGQSVKAGDFEYAWKRALNPDTAAEYAYQLYYLKNGQGYNESKLPDANVSKGIKKATAGDVGVKAIDDNTLEVNLEYPTLYFLSLMAFPTYAPVRKDIVEGNEKWTLKPETYISNGAFKMTEWKAKDVIVFEKNTKYWDAANIKLDKINYKMLDDQNASLAGFKSGQLDLIQGPPQQEIPKLVADGTAKIYPSLSTYYFCLNLSPEADKIDAAAGKALKDPRVRKALSLAIDRKVIVEKVALGGQIPATSFVPTGIPDDKGADFTNKQYYTPEANVEEAKKLLAEAGFADGVGFPNMTIMYNTSQGHQNIAAAVQDMWRTNLGIQVDLRNQEWKVFQKTRNDKQYLIARHGWSGDYIDPMTFLDLFVTNGGNNDAAYSNAKYDEKIAGAKKEIDPAKRMALLHEAEDILMEDMPIIPIYYYTTVVCQKPTIKDVRISPLGQVYFNKAYVTEK